MRDLSHTLNAVLILILTGVLTGGFYEELYGTVPPCPLCYLQRLCMIGVATGALMNLKFSIRIRHYAFSLTSALIGGAVALRQISLHVCPPSPRYGEQVLGLSLYTWSFIVFCCSAVVLIMLLIDYHRTDHSEREMTRFEHVVMAILMAVTTLNIVSVFHHCRFGICE